MTQTDLATTLERAQQAQEMGTELAKPGKRPANVAQLLLHEGYRNQMAHYFHGDRDMAQRLIRIAFTEVRAINHLSECSADSFGGALMQCAVTNLEPGRPMGFAWILPFKVKDAYEATFVIGYPGVVQLALRSGQMADIRAHSVHEEDQFEYDLGLNWITHKPPKRGSRGPVYAYYAVAQYTNGGRHIHVMSLEEVADHAERYSRSYQQKSATSPWRTNFDEMAEKTCVLQMRRYLPASPAFVAAMKADERVTLWTPEGLKESEPEALPETSES